MKEGIPKAEPEDKIHYLVIRVNYRIIVGLLAEGHLL
jgi:hypothetical protein